jgi:hypothetical protein
VESDSSTVVNARVGFRGERYDLHLDLLNVFDSDDDDITYLYASRLPGEPANGIVDRHFHRLSRGRCAPFSAGNSDSRLTNATESCRSHPYSASLDGGVDMRRSGQAMGAAKGVGFKNADPARSLTPSPKSDVRLMRPFRQQVKEASNGKSIGAR